MRIGHALNAAVVDNGTHVRGTQRTSEVQRINGGPQTQIVAAPRLLSTSTQTVKCQLKIQSEELEVERRALYFTLYANELRGVLNTMRMSVLVSATSAFC